MSDLIFLNFFIYIKFRLLLAYLEDSAPMTDDFILNFYSYYSERNEFKMDPGKFVN